MARPKKDSIRLSEKHGLNPTIGVCFWCGKETGELALLGYLGKGDPEAPRHTVLNYDPCPACAEKWKQGVAFIEVTDAPETNRPEIQDGYYPTGHYVVLKKEAAERLGVDSPRVLVDEETFTRLFNS